jgi:predicted nucleotidyltransferase
MIPLIEEHRAELEALCRQHGVKTLELFGSATDGTFDPTRSDLDFLVEFMPQDPVKYAKSYFGMLHGCEDLFHRKIDLVVYGSLQNRYLIAEIDKQRTALYAA